MRQFGAVGSIRVLDRGRLNLPGERPFESSTAAVRSSTASQNPHPIFVDRLRIHRNRSRALSKCSAPSFRYANGFAPERVRKHRIGDQFAILAQLARRINEPAMQESLIVGASLVQVMDQGSQIVGIEPTKLRLNDLPGWPSAGWLCFVFSRRSFRNQGRGLTSALSRGARVQRKST